MNTIRALAAAIDAKDPYTCGHSQRVMKYTLMAAKILQLSPERLKAVEYGGILHDVGKVSVDEAILRKPTSLTPEEWVVMQAHPQAGANIVEGIAFLKEAKELVLHHHEKYDGKGYPDGLQGEDIPIGARLLAVSDAFDTMTSQRPYRTPVTIPRGIEELRRCAGKQFCSIAVEAFVESLRKYSGKPLPEASQDPV